MLMCSCLLRVMLHRVNRINNTFNNFDTLIPGKYAQVTNNPENDGCINAVLLVWCDDCMFRHISQTLCHRLFHYFMETIFWGCVDACCFMLFASLPRRGSHLYSYCNRNHNKISYLTNVNQSENTCSYMWMF